MSLTELIKQLARRGLKQNPNPTTAKRSVSPGLLPLRETFNDWLERQTNERERWIQAHAEEPIDCPSCKKTHPIGRLHPEGGCAGPAPPPRPAPPPLPEPEPPKPSMNPVYEHYPPPPTTRARPSGSKPRDKKQQVDHDAEWESFRTHRSSYGGDW